MILSIIVIILLLLAAALTAASEISIIAVSRFKLRRIAASGSKSARIVLKILEAPEKFFSTILVLNNVVDTLIAAIITVMMVEMFGENKGIIFATVIASLAIIVFEVVAKTLAAIHSEKISLMLARPVRGLITLFSPVVKGLVHVTNFILRIVSSQVQTKPTLVTDEELKALIKITAEEDIPHKEKYKMLSKVFDFSDAIVKNVMTAKKDIISINVDAPFDEILEKVLESGYSRIPVYKGDPDNVIGIINMKDLLSLSFNKGLVVLQDIVYPATFVSSSKKVSELLREFQKGHTHLAIVHNEQNKIDGIVTLEDLVEEIVGEIEDEYDVRASNYKTKHI